LTLNAHIASRKSTRAVFALEIPHTSDPVGDLNWHKHCAPAGWLLASEAAWCLRAFAARVECRSGSISDDGDHDILIRSAARLGWDKTCAHAPVPYSGAQDVVEKADVRMVSELVRGCGIEQGFPATPQGGCLPCGRPRRGYAKPRPIPRAIKANRQDCARFFIEENGRPIEPGRS